jgi:hypothetical protein
MNAKLMKAMFDLEKVDALMHSAEAYLMIEVPPENREMIDRGGYIFYAIWDAIQKVSEDLEQLSGDCLVVDAIYAAEDVRRRRGTLRTEK